MIERWKQRAEETSPGKADILWMMLWMLRGSSAPHQADESLG